MSARSATQDRRARGMAILAALAIGAAGLPACSSALDRHTRTVAPEDFATAASAETPPAPGPTYAPPVRALPTWEPAPLDRNLAVTTTVGAPSPPAPAAAASDAPVILDALVGQVNGRPIYASEILEPLDGKLRALTDQTKDRRSWLNEATRAIVGELQRIVEDELILAEARSALSPEQRQGLFRFLNEIQGNLVSERRGSAVAADESLREATGRSLHEEARDRLDRELIGYEVRKRVSPRVNISWRQIQQSYENNYGKYNPAATARLRLVLAPKDKPEVAEQIRAALASGTPFPEVADGPLNEVRGSASVFESNFSGDYTQGEFFAVPALNDAARGLTVGQTIGPIDYDGRAAWVHLESIQQPTGTSLYDAQLAIEQELRDQKLREESTRYFDRLKARGSVSRMEDMVARLLTVATERYLPAER